MTERKIYLTISKVYLPILEVSTSLENPHLHILIPFQGEPKEIGHAKRGGRIIARGS